MKKPPLGDGAAAGPNKLILPDELSARFKTGISAGELFGLSHRIGIQPEQFNRMTGVNTHKLRRGRGGSEPIAAEVAPSFVRCVRLFHRALALCGGNEEAAKQWLNAEAPALGRKKPIDAAETEAGFKKVDALLTQLENAVRR